MAARTRAALRAAPVVELAGDPAGEMIGKLLAEMGADVVKVEPPDGLAQPGASGRSSTATRTPTTA